MIEVPPTSLLMLGFCTFLLGVFAADVLLKLFARVLNWRITYENGCKKCGHEAGFYVVMDAECIHCIFVEADKLSEQSRELLDESRAMLDNLQESERTRKEDDE